MSDEPPDAGPGSKRNLFDFSGFEPPEQPKSGRLDRARGKHKGPVRESARRRAPREEAPREDARRREQDLTLPALPPERAPVARGAATDTTARSTSPRPVRPPAVEPASPPVGPEPRSLGTVTVDDEPEVELEEAFDPGTFFASDVFGPRSSITAQVPRQLPYQPALEGLRGVAIIAVLLFLADAPFFGGGFLAISTFLTLTGFLVTRNLLGRWLNDEPIVFGEVVKARLRRIMPLAVLGVAAAVAYTVTVGDVIQVNNLFGDVLSSLTFTSNWRFIAERQSYLSLLSSPSALEQYWSLAVAEQVNFVVLLVALGATISIGRGRSKGTGTGRTNDTRAAVRAFTLVIVVLIILSVGCTIAFGYSHSRVYLGTDTRAAEVLIGALLAVMLVHRPSLGSSRYAPTIALAGLIAGVASVALWFVTPISSPWVYAGGLSAYALLSTAAIAGCLVPHTPMATALSVRPLREVGRISFGLYVFAWPVFLLLSPERVSVPGPALFIARIATTAALAVAAHRYVDAPVKAGRNLYGFRPSAAVGGTIAVIMLATMATASNAPAPATDLSQPYSTAGVAIGNGTVSIPNIAVFGDSTAIPIQRGLTKWVESTNRAVSRPGRFAVGCGVVPGGAWQLGATTGDTPERCDRLPEEWTQALEPGAPSIAIVTPGLLEVANRRVPGDDSWRAIGVPEVELYYVKQMLAITDTLSSKGAKVVWVTMPPILAGTQHDARPDLGQAADPARAQRFNELIGKVRELRPDTVAVLDLASWLAENDPDGHRFRPDGLHLSDGGATTVAQDFLAPQLLRLVGQDPNTTVGLPGLPTVPGSGSMPDPAVPPAGVPGAAVPGAAPAASGSSACSALRTFRLTQTAVEGIVNRTRAEREQSFSALLTTGSELQQLAPELNDAVEARELYWSEALGLTQAEDSGPVARPLESEEQKAATATMLTFEQTRCG